MWPRDRDRFVRSGAEARWPPRGEPGGRPACSRLTTGPWPGQEAAGVATVTANRSGFLAGPPGAPRGQPRPPMPQAGLSRAPGQTPAALQGSRASHAWDWRPDDPAGSVACLRPGGAAGARPAGVAGLAEPPGRCQAHPRPEERPGNPDQDLQRFATVPGAVPRRPGGQAPEEVGAGPGCSETPVHASAPTLSQPQPHPPFRGARAPSGAPVDPLPLPTSPGMGCSWPSHPRRGRHAEGSLPGPTPPRPAGRPGMGPSFLVTGLCLSWNGVPGPSPAGD